MAGINSQTQSDIFGRVFTERTSTLDAEASVFDLPDLLTTIVENLDATRSVVLELPETAFAVPERVMANGEVDWLAGKIVSHVCDIQHRVCGQAAQLMGAADAATALEAIGSWPDTIGQREAVDVLTAAGDAQRSFNAHFPVDGDTTSTSQSERFGTVGPKGWLLLQVIHSNTHRLQLRALMD